MRQNRRDPELERKARRKECREPHVAGYFLFLVKSFRLHSAGTIGKCAK